MSSNAKSEKMKLAPFRSMSEFILDSGKYTPPTFNDLKRFNNRVISNLLYYQTNYFAISVAVFGLFLLIQFGRLLTGAFGIGFTLATGLFAMDRIPQAASLRRAYPMATYGALAVNLMVLYATLRPVMFFLLVVLVPILFWILHASMRSRGIKNKVSNKMEQIGAHVYANTPMELIVTSLGLEARDCDD